MGLDDEKVQARAARLRSAGRLTMFGDTSTKRGGGTRRGRTEPVLLALCALAFALACAVAAMDYWSNAGKIYRGVSVGGVALGGTTQGEAERVLEARARELEGVRLEGPGPSATTLDADHIDVAYDVEKSVEEAYSVGREGGPLARLGDRIGAALGIARVPAVVDYRPEAVRAVLEDLAAELGRSPQGASVVVRGQEVEVTGAAEGYRLDVASTEANVRRALEDLDPEARVTGEVLRPKVATPAAEETAAEARRAVSGPVVLTAEGRRWELSPDEVGRSLSFSPRGEKLEATLDRGDLKAGLEDLYADLTVAPVEAGYEFDGGGVKVTPGRAGKRIEEEKLFDALEAGLFDGEREYQVSVVVEEPELTTVRAEELKPTERLGSYRTDYSIVPDTGRRVENLRIASNAVGGTTLAPGEVFSMNDTVSSLDYNATKVIVDGQETKADGGGLCQVTSTLYMAVNEAGLDVTERSPHYAQLPYIRPGLDATVWFGDENGDGALDMKFENTTKAYVLLREWVADDGYVYAEVWGRPNGAEVKTWSKPIYRDRYSAKWVTYQRYEKDGEVLYDGVLHKDTYEALRDKKGKLIPADSVPIAPVDP